MEPTPVSLIDRLVHSPDRAAWDRFVELYTPLLVAWCRRLGLSDADVADYTQDVFVVLVEQLPRFRYDPNGSFRAWLKTVLLNAWRKRARKGAREAGHLLDADAVPQTDPGDLLAEAEHREALVRRALALMQTDFEPATWQACWQFVVEDRPAAEVAAALGISVNAVYLAKSRVLRHLRTELAGLLD